MLIRSGRGVPALAPLLSVLVLIMLSGCNRTLNLPGGADAYRIMQPDAARPSPEYRIGTGDQISVNVHGFADLSAASLIVDPTGEISLPLIGSVHAGGTTTRELAEAIERRLRPRYLLDPRVAVNVTEYASNFVTVEGRVAQPGILTVVGTTTLLTVIARSRGPTALARVDEVAVFRTINGERMAAKFDLQAIREGTAPDPVILANDTVVVGFDRLEGAWRDFLQAAPVFAIFSRPFY